MKHPLTSLTLAALILAVLIPGSLLAADKPVVLFDGKSLENWTVIACEAIVTDGETTAVDFYFVPGPC